jgi:hypothetical protein
LPEQSQIPVLNMPAVFSQMHRDSVGSADFRQHGRVDRIRFVGASRLPQCGNMIDIYAEQWH